MKGKGCVGIAADRRLGVKGSTLTMDFQKIFGEWFLLLSLDMNSFLFSYLLPRNGTQDLRWIPWIGN